MIIGVLLVSFPVIKHTVTLVKFQTTSLSYAKQLPEVTPNDAIVLPTLTDYWQSSADEVGEAVGQIIIPDIELEVPLFYGLKQEELLYGAGLMYPQRNFETDNIVIVGHHLTIANVLFGKLQELKQDSLIMVEFMGENFLYRVKMKHLVSEKELAVLENQSEPQLTLITCDKPERTEQRLVVVGELLEEEKDDIRHVVQSPMNKSTYQYTDTFIRYSVLPLVIILSTILMFSWLIWRYI
ncbi:class A sortase [Vagococcus zengguangii]|nr:class A sortase [Vagococcus zengguangii]